MRGGGSEYFLSFAPPCPSTSPLLCNTPPSTAFLALPFFLSIFVSLPLFILSPRSFFFFFSLSFLVLAERRCLSNGTKFSGEVKSFRSCNLS